MQLALKERWRSHGGAAVVLKTLAPREQGPPLDTRILGVTSASAATQQGYSRDAAKLIQALTTWQCKCGWV